MLEKFILATPLAGEERNTCMVITRADYYAVFPKFEPITSFDTKEKADAALREAERLGGAKEYLQAKAVLPDVSLPEGPALQ